MQQLKRFEGNLDPRARWLSDSTTAVFLFVFGAVLLLSAVSAWHAMLTPKSSPPYALWAGLEWLWGSVTTVVGGALMVGAWVHSRNFGYSSFRFSSNERHAHVVGDIGEWLKSRPFHSAELFLFRAGEIDSVYELDIVEPRSFSPNNALIRSLLIPPPLPEGVVRSVGA